MSNMISILVSNYVAKKIYSLKMAVKTAEDNI